MPPKFSRIIDRAGWIIGVLLLAILWTMASYWKWLDETLIATPDEVWQTIKAAFVSDALNQEKFHIHAGYTILSATKGWGIGIGLGLIFGILLGSVISLHRSLEIVVEFARAIPPILAFPLLLVAYNYEQGAYTWSIAFGCLPVVILTVSSGFEKINRDAIEVLRFYRVKPWFIALARGTELLPSLILAARLSFSLALIIAVVTEMVFTPRSGWALGALARDSEINFNTPMFYTCVLVIGLYGYLVNMLLGRLGHAFGTNK